jgi:hypothetical protein
MDTRIERSPNRTAGSVRYRLWNANPTRGRLTEFSSQPRYLWPNAISSTERPAIFRAASMSLQFLPPVSPHDCSDEAEIAGGAVGEDDL